MCRNAWLRGLAVLLILSGAYKPVSAELSVKAEIDSYFVGLKAEFDRIVSAPVIKRPAVAPVNTHFLKALKRHRPFYALVRTDAKGITVNEVIRLVTTTPPKRDVSSEAWFKHVKNTRQEYTGRVKLEQTGRYYLVWAAPILAESKSGVQEFKGAVMLMVDLWDCFQKFSKVTRGPFLVRMGHLFLYSHNWSDTIGYVEEPLVVPGVRRIYVRSAESGVAEPETLATAVALAESVQAAPGCSSRDRRGAWIALLLIVVILETVVLAFYVIKPLAVLREKWFAGLRGQRQGGFY